MSVIRCRFGSRIICPKLKILSTGPEDGRGVLYLMNIDLTEGNWCSILSDVSADAKNRRHSSLIVFSFEYTSIDSNDPKLKNSSFLFFLRLSSEFGVDGDEGVCPDVLPVLACSNTALLNKLSTSILLDSGTHRSLKYGWDTAAIIASWWSEEKLINFSNRCVNWFKRIAGSFSHKLGEVLLICSNDSWTLINVGVTTP